MEDAPRSEELPKGQPLELNSDNIEMIERLKAFDASRIFSTANRSNNDVRGDAIFVFVSDPMAERRPQPQRVFHLQAMLKRDRDVRKLVDSLRRESTASAVRVISLYGDRLWGAVQYDPLDGTANADISISS